MSTTTMEKTTTRPEATGNKAAIQPAPRQLATPTDLSPEGVRAITEALNGLIADAFALYVKTKNYHWHLASSHFRDYHLLFDEHADQIFVTIDPLAERLRKIGGTTIRSIGHIASLQSVEDSNEDFVAPGEMVRRLMEDNKQMAASMRKAHETCDEYRDVATASVLEVFIDETERRTWFLFEVAQSGEAPTR
jgi:starvation-inducible DNA-binding protein